MACCMFSAKPLPESVLSYCRLDHTNRISAKCKSKYRFFFFQNNTFENVVYEMAAFMFRSQCGNMVLKPGAWFDIEAIFPGMVIRQSWDHFLHNGNSYTGKKASLYWDGPLLFPVQVGQLYSCWCPVFMCHHISNYGIVCVILVLAFKEEGYHLTEPS